MLSSLRIFHGDWNSAKRETECRHADKETREEPCVRKSERTLKIRWRVDAQGGIASKSCQKGCLLRTVNASPSPSGAGESGEPLTETRGIIRFAHKSNMWTHWIWSTRKSRSVILTLPSLSESWQISLEPARLTGWVELMFRLPGGIAPQNHRSS